jgi:hypothetical protein
MPLSTRLDVTRATSDTPITTGVKMSIAAKTGRAMQT